MNYLLDTDICIYLIKKTPPEILQKFNTYVVGDIGVSAITVAELQYGVEKSQCPSQNQQALDQFLLPLLVLDFDYQTTIVYGQIRALLERQGTPIGPLDTLIAAHALRLNATLVTNNTKEFSKIPNLKLTNWLTDD